MKKLIILIFMLFSVLSCSKEKENNTEIIKEQVWIIEESGDIIGDYVDTLEWEIIDAKKVKNQIESDQNKLKNELNKLK